MRGYRVEICLEVEQVPATTSGAELSQSVPRKRERSRLICTSPSEENEHLRDMRRESSLLSPSLPAGGISRGCFNDELMAAVED